MKMKNETAIITGSTSGIGKKLAELFLRQGCKVAICSRKEANVKSTLEEFQKTYGDSVIGDTCDVSDPESLKSFVKKVTDVFGSIRILVANAGLNLTYGPFEYIPLDKVASDAKTVIGTNLIGMIHSVSAVLPQMIKQGYGRIISLSGGGADRPMEHMTIYSASKGGVVAFSKCLVEELKQRNDDIKLNIFQPGMIDTNLGTNIELSDKSKDKEAYEREMELIRKHVMTDVEESTKNVIPYVLPSCKKNGEIFRGFSIMKLIKGFKKVSKAQKVMEADKN